MASPFHRFKINCDCASYVWVRRPARKGTHFLRCKGCGKKLGDMSVTDLGVVPKPAFLG